MEKSADSKILQELPADINNNNNHTNKIYQEEPEPYNPDLEILRRPSLESYRSSTSSSRRDSETSTTSDISFSDLCDLTSDHDFLKTSFDKKIDHFFSDRNIIQNYPQDFDRDWKNLNINIGHGVNGSIWKLQSRNNSQSLTEYAALKTINTRLKFNKNDDCRPQVQLEIYFHYLASKYVQSVVPILGIYYEPRPQKYHFVTKYVAGQTLKTRICDILEGVRKPFTLLEIKKITRQLVYTLFLLHTKSKLKVAHRDIKVENILINDYETDENQNDLKITLIDFGFVGRITDKYGNSLLTNPAHTPTNVAPEVYKNFIRNTKFRSSCQKTYTEKCDVWSLAVVLYEIYFLKLPFHAIDLANGLPGKPIKTETVTEIMEECMNEGIVFPHLKGKCACHVVDVAKVNGDFIDLLRKMFRPDPKERISCQEILEHSFVNNIM